MDGVFVGRTNELATLHAAVADAVRAPTAVLVVGDPGSGKTRLVREAAAAASRSRAVRGRRLRARAQRPDHGPDAGTPGKADSCYQTTGGVPPAQDDENPALG